MSKGARLLLVLAIIVAVWWALPDGPIKKPIMLAVLGVPLAFGFVPRNYLYGLRTARTLRSSDDARRLQYL